MDETQRRTLPCSWRDMLHGVVSESRRVVAAHSRHFLALSILFLLPLSSLTVASPFLLPALSSPHPPSSLRLSDDHTAASAAGAVPIIIFAAAAASLYICAAASISTSVHRGFFDRPVRIVSVLRSIPAAALRLLLTLISSLLILAVLTALLSSILLLLLSIRQIYSSLTPLLYAAFAAIALFAFLRLRIDWSLAGTIAVREPIWGFAPLRRSAELVSGMRWAAAILDAFFSIGIGLVVWGFGLGCDSGSGEVLLPLVVRTVFGSAVTAVLLLYGIVTSTVLYMYCKAMHGELAGEIAEEFAWEYVSLPFDEHKIPRLVSVVQSDAAGGAAVGSGN